MDHKGYVPPGNEGDTAVDETSKPFVKPAPVSSRKSLKRSVSFSKQSSLIPESGNVSQASTRDSNESLSVDNDDDVSPVTKRSRITKKNIGHTQPVSLLNGDLSDLLSEAEEETMVVDELNPLPASVSEIRKQKEDSDSSEFQPSDPDSDDDPASDVKSTPRNQPVTHRLISPEYGDNSQIRDVDYQTARRKALADGAKSFPSHHDWLENNGRRKRTEAEDESDIESFESPEKTQQQQFDEDIREFEFASSIIPETPVQHRRHLLDRIPETDPRLLSNASVNTSPVTPSVPPFVPLEGEQIASADLRKPEKNCCSKSHDKKHCYIPNRRDPDFVLDDILFQSGIYIQKSTHIIYCRCCGSIIKLGSLLEHLQQSDKHSRNDIRDKHGHRVSYKMVVEKVQALLDALGPEPEVTFDEYLASLAINGPAPFVEISEALQCVSCSYATKSKDLMRKHGHDPKDDYPPPEIKTIYIQVFLNGTPDKRVVHSRLKPIDPRIDKEGSTARKLFLDTVNTNWMKPAYVPSFLSWYPC